MVVWQYCCMVGFGKWLCEFLNLRTCLSQTTSQLVNYVSVSGKRPDDQNDDCDQEDHDRDAVHPMHEENIDIARLIRVALFQE